MKMADILHSIADLLDKVEDDKPAQSPVIVNVNGGNAAAPAAAPEQNTELDDDPTMVPPLQQKLEIMKKLAGIPNNSNSIAAVAADEDEPYEG